MLTIGFLKNTVYISSIFRYVIMAEESPSKTAAPVASAARACADESDRASVPYAELHCISNFTFLRGASFPEELVETANALGYRAIAITDECSLSGVVRAHMAARERALKLIIGSEFRLQAATGADPYLVLLACNRKGYCELSHLIPSARRE